MSPRLLGRPFLGKAGLLLMAMLVGCDPESSVGVSGRPRPTSTHPVTPSPTATASVSPSPTLAPSPTPTPSPSPTPSAQATPRIGVLSISVTPWFATLFPPPADPQRGLGLPVSTQLTAVVTRSDQTLGGVKWVDRSGGQLQISSSGVVTVASTASPGFYQVRAIALDDEGMTKDVTIEVRTTSQLEVTVD